MIIITRSYTLANPKPLQAGDLSEQLGDGGDSAAAGGSGAAAAAAGGKSKIGSNITIKVRRPADYDHPPLRLTLVARADSGCRPRSAPAHASLLACG